MTTSKTNLTSTTKSSSATEPTTTPSTLHHRHPTSTQTPGHSLPPTPTPSKTNLLLPYASLPPWRRDNHYIHTGYRPESNSYNHSFLSAFTLHNETINIWTHLLPSIIFLSSLVLAILSTLFAGTVFAWTNVLGPRYHEVANSTDVLVFTCFLGGAVVCLGMSATYHSLSNHSMEVAKWGNKLDYSGIVVLIVGSYVPALYYGLFCHERLMVGYLGLISLLGLGCLLISWLDHFRTPSYRPFRALLFVSLGLSGIIPLLHALLFLYPFSTLDRRMGLTHVILQGLLYIAGAGIYAARWPERWFPGRFDIWGSSHQIFHVFVVMAATAHAVGMVRAFDYHHDMGGCGGEVGGGWLR